LHSSRLVRFALSIETIGQSEQRQGPRDRTLGESMSIYAHTRKNLRFRGTAQGSFGANFHDGSGS